VLIGGGSRNETEEQGGAFHFIEHLLFKGTRRRPTAREISETMEGVGGVMNAATDRELTTYWCKAARPHLQTGVDLLSDMLRNSLFDPEEMERERGVVLEELAMTRDHPDDWVEVIVDSLIWPDQPLGRDVAGTPASVQGLSRETLLGCMAGQYVPSNAVVAVAGDVSLQEVMQLLEERLGDWPPGRPAPWLPASDGQTAPRVRVERRQSEQAHLALVVRALPATHPQRHALDLLSIILGEGMSSRLFLSLREEQGLVYSVSSAVSRFRDTGALGVSASTAPANGPKAVKGIVAELHKATKEIPLAELAKAKEMAKGRLLLRLEDTRSMAFWVGGQELLLDRVRTVDEVLAGVEAVTREEVLELARRLLVPEGMSLAVVGPYRSPVRFQALLEA
jgi:predicted Zn-dependent peptidase